MRLIVVIFSLFLVCFVSAAKECPEGEKHASGDPSGFSLAGQKHLALRDGVAAAACFRRALKSPKLTPKERAPLQRYLAVALQMQGRLEAAAKAAEQAVDIAQGIDDDEELAQALEVRLNRSLDVN